MYHMIIEQTKHYKNRIEYNPTNNSFTETNQLSLFYARECPYPYGWIKESGAPPGYHKDVILVSELEHGLGDQLEIKLIGIFKRADGDHKLVAVVADSTVDDLFQLNEVELNYLKRLYPRMDEGEGWFGRDAIHKSDVKEKVLVLGGSGFIGKAIIKALLDDPQWDLYSTFNSSVSPLDDRKSIKLDLSCLDDFIVQLKTTSPDIVISCMRGNFELQLNLHHEIAEFLKSKNGRMYFFSTANVFDEDKSKVHFETDQTSSISPYGQFKIKCETLLQQKLGENACIIRLSQVWGKNSPRLNQLKAAAQNGIGITVYPNLFISTVTDELIVQCMSYLLANDLRGIFHITASDVTSYKSFYQNLVLAMGLTNVSLIDNGEEEGYFAIASEKIDQFPQCFSRTNQYIIDMLCT